MPTSRRIALFLDGTWNIVENNTNVWRLKTLCVPESPDQVTYYSAGVGTQIGTKFVGGIFGWGLDQEVKAAYEWLMENYNSGDEIFIFGFSRGAFTARALSGLISKCGLLQVGTPIGVSELYARYRLNQSVRTIRVLSRVKEEKPDPSFTVEENWLLEYSMAVPIKFVGVWDTVGALGVPFGNIPVISRRRYAFLETDLRIDNDFAYHALAIDEQRGDFAPTLWTRTVRSGQPAYPERPIHEVEQRWFVGAHANVGGGYSSDLLPQIPLQWLMGKASTHGLQFRHKVTIDGDELKSQVNDSFSEMIWGLYPILKLGHRYYRPIGRKPTTSPSGDVTATINETIDPSVFERWRQDNTYRPKNLIDWQKTHSVDIGNLTSSVRADQPTVLVP
jgi:uncharacterized protein (DUF2235 family)